MVLPGDSGALENSALGVATVEERVSSSPSSFKVPVIFGDSLQTVDSFPRNLKACPPNWIIHVWLFSAKFLLALKFICCILPLLLPCIEFSTSHFVCTTSFFILCPMPSPKTPISKFFSTFYHRLFFLFFHTPSLPSPFSISNHHSTTTSYSSSYSCSFTLHTPSPPPSFLHLHLFPHTPSPTTILLSPPRSISLSIPPLTRDERPPSSSCHVAPQCTHSHAQNFPP